MTALRKDLLVGLGLVVGLGTFGYGLIEASFLRQHLASNTWFRDLLIAATVALVLASACRVLFRTHFWHATSFVYVGFILVTFGPAAVGAVALLWLLSLALGAAILRPADDGSVALQCVTGLAVLLLALGISVQFPVNTRFTYLVGAVVIIASLHRPLGEVLARLIAQARRPSCPPSVGTVLLAAAALFVFAWHGLGAALPERFWDPLVVHLYVPAYIEAFGVWDLPPDAGVFTAMPMAIDLGFSAAFLLGGEAAAHLIDLTFLLLLAILLFQTLCLYVSAQTAGWLTLVFATTPIAFFETRALMIEHGLMLFLFAAFTALIKTENNVRGAFEAACLCLAAAIASKLQGAVVAAAIGILLIPHLGFRGGPGRVAWRLTVAVMCAAMGLVPYLAAYLRTKNPLFPFFNSHFGSPFFPAVDFADTRWPPYLSWDSIYQFTFDTTRFGEHQVGAFGFQTVLFFVAVVLATALFPRRYLIISFMIALLYAATLLLQIAYVRYLYIIFPFLTLAFVSLWLASGWLKVVAAICTGLAIVTNLVYLTSAAGVLTDVSLDNVYDRDEHERLTEIFVGERKLVDRLNASDFPAPRVLLIGALPGPLAGIAYQANWYSWFLNDRLRGASAPDEVLAALREKGITHVLLGREAKTVPLVTQTVLASGVVIDQEASVLLVELEPHVWGESVNLVQNTDPASLPNAPMSFALRERAAGEARLYRVVATVNCGAALDVVYVQVNWAGSGGGLGAESKPLVCQASGLQDLTVDLVSPPGASSGTLMEVVREDGGESAFHSIQFWRGQAVPEPWVW